MTARRLLAFSGLVLSGALLLLWLVGSPRPVRGLGPVTGDSERLAEAVRRGFAGRTPVAEAGPVGISTRVLDFGQVPIDFPAREMLYLMNKAGVQIRVMGSGLDTPFKAEQSSFDIDPHASGGLAIVFDPSKPGLYEQRLRLTLGDARGGVDHETEILIRGRGVISPLTAGIQVPPRPDEEIRRYQEQQREKALADAEAALEARRIARQGREAERGAAETDDPSGAPLDSAAAAAADPAGVPPRPEVAGVRPASQRTAIAAFGMSLGGGPDLNDIPAPIPEGETVPDLPPGDDPGDDSGNGADPADGNDADPDSGDGGRNDDDAETDQDPTGLFTIAPNSTVLVYSSREPIMFQSHRLVVNGSSFLLDGRMIFPTLSMAFGQNISLDQWGNIQGSIGADGSVQMSMTVRIYDTNGNILDLPLNLTTGMAVGYSSEGRLMFANGIPRDPVTGNVKMVGITNVPLGQGSSIDKAPVYLEILARLQI